MRMKMLLLLCLAVMPTFVHAGCCSIATEKGTSTVDENTGWVKSDAVIYAVTVNG